MPTVVRRFIKLTATDVDISLNFIEFQEAQKIKYCVPGIANQSFEINPMSFGQRRTFRQLCGTALDLKITCRGFAETSTAAEHSSCNGVEWVTHAVNHL